MDEQYNYYCLNKITGLTKDGEGNIVHTDLIAELPNYTQEELDDIMQIRGAVYNVTTEQNESIGRITKNLFDNMFIEIYVSKYNNFGYINKIIDNYSLGSILYIRCKTVSKYKLGIPSEALNTLPEYIDVLDLKCLEDGKSIPLLKITAKEFYKGLDCIAKSNVINI